MTLHIDILENEWSAGRQIVAARLRTAGSKCELRATDTKKWLRVLGMKESSEDFGSIAAAHKFLESTAGRLTGDYVFATGPHDADSCPYPDDLADWKRGGHLVVRKAASHKA